MTDAESVGELFATEISAYHERKSELLRSHFGRFVLIKGNGIHGPYDTENDAIKDGYANFGNNPFLVRKVLPFEREATFFGVTIDAA